MNDVIQTAGLFVMFAAAAAAMYASQSVMMATDRKLAAAKAARAERKEEAEKLAELIERLDADNKKD